ncbi:hypothetical protein GWK36_01610 [Caldichromatium japonicum]|uniref:Uncharacterized protein n=1 Tax=Caldichromatium japonicum TaxID=2699430 RepID=A0A6G7VAM6_9GAMM|nr:hypothetical protein [Caldichromatium japonicum]QIK36908.1 hypothetical protein GWK36_01610 [Caldichromatium japonicum]
MAVEAQQPARDAGSLDAPAARQGRAERPLASFTDAFKEARLLGTKAAVYFDIPVPAR